MKRYAFVVPRFGEGFMGGAESLCGALAQELIKRGEQVEILTTCAKDNRTWENELPAGKTQSLGLCVRRFPVSERSLDAWVPLQIQVSQGKPLPLDKQFEWLENSVISHELFKWIWANGEEYDALIFAPYLFGTTFWGALIHPERSLLLPCLHDESYAYVDAIASMFRKVRGCIYNASAEKNLSERLYGSLPGGVVGMGFELPEGPSTLPRLHDKSYLLCLGRKETGKNVHHLIDLFRWYIQENRASDLDLIIAGGGDYADLHRAKCDRVIDFPRVSEEEKRVLLRDATALVQPSVNESFSIVLMESWLERTPVVVHGACAVTREHVMASNGGLYFNDAHDFYGVVKTLETDSELRYRMGHSGFNYVAANYNWDAVVERFQATVNAILQAADTEASVEG